MVDRIEFNNNVTNRRHKVTFHTLRHTFCSHLAIQGETLQTIAELAGHKTLQMVKRYSHLSEGHKRSAALNLEKKLTLKRTEDNVLTITAVCVDKTTG